MRLLVLLRQLLNPAGMLVNRKAGKVFVNREEYMINPADKRALEAALQIKDATGAEVVAAAVGPAHTEDALREARALGANRAILIKEDHRDVAAPPAGRVYKALCDSLGDVDLILTGDSALDTGEAVGPQLAEMVNMAFLGNAVQCTVEGTVVRIVRRDVRDAMQRAYNGVEADLPAVVTVTRSGPTPRYPHGGAIIEMYRNPEAVEIMTAADLGLDDSALQPAVVERGQSFPPEREFGKQMTVEEIAKRMNNE